MSIKMSHLISRRIGPVKKLLQGNSLVILKSKSTFCSSTGSHDFLSPESNPVNHTLKDAGLIYSIDNSLSLNILFKHARLLPEYVEECYTFQKTPIMIRKPALEIINCLKNTNFDNPINKYVLYGKRGHGVSMTMLHLVHYAYASEWLIVHLPKLVSWLTQKTERIESTTNPGLLDLPVVYSAWLDQFKTLNLNVINKHDLRLQNDYSWNIQEENKKGDSLLSLIDHGIARGKYSCDVIIGLLDEVKMYSRKKIVRTLVAMDNFSIVFHPKRKSSNRKFKYLAPSQLSVMESFKNMAKSDWHNGAVVLACQSEPDAGDTDHLPLNKLTLKGFEFLNPFVPIEVPRLTEAEMMNMLDFYRSEKWLLTSHADEQLKVLSAGSIKTLQNLCGHF